MIIPEKFDKAQINADNIRVTEAEIKEAMEAVDLTPAGSNEEIHGKHPPLP